MKTDYKKTGVEVDPQGTTWHLKDGHLHREDGPALIFKSGIKGYYIYGQFVDVDCQEEFERSKEFREWKIKVFS